MTDQQFDAMRADYDALVRKPNTNVIATWTEGDNLIVTVLDDSEEALAPLATRDPRVIFRKGGPFVAYDDPKRYRPAPGGVSVGHYQITAGTLGAYFGRIGSPGKVYMLSNAHVLANENLGNPGDAIYQPGPYHGGGPADTIAHLTKSIHLEKTHNLVDAAIAEMINNADADLNNLGIGRIYGAVPTIVGQDLYKRGARSELSRGVAIAIDATIEVGYENTTRVFDDCVVSNVFAAPGDSGSLICDFYGNFATSLLFAGGGGYTISCKFEHVARLLELGILPFDEVLRGLITDVSHWQWPVSAEAFNAGADYAAGNFKLNYDDLTPLSFSKMASRGTYAVIAKAFQPPALFDAHFGDYCDYAEEAGMLKTGYVFCDPAYSWREHLDGLKQAIGPRKMDFSAMLDWEFTNGQTPAVITSLYKNLNKAVADWQGKPAINYTSPAWYDVNILPFDNDYDLPLLIAFWSDTALAPLLPKRYSANQKQQIGWQVGPRDVGPAFGVGSAQIDLSRFYPGFRELIFDGAPPPPVSGSISISASASPSPSAMPPPGPAEFVVNKGTTQVNGQNVRAAPYVGATVLAGLQAGWTVYILAWAKDKDGNDWVQIAIPGPHKEYWAAQYHKGTLYIDVLQEGEA